MNLCTRTTPTAVLDITPGVRDTAGSPDTHHPTAPNGQPPCLCLPQSSATGHPHWACSCHCCQPPPHPPDLEVTLHFPVRKQCSRDSHIPSCSGLSKQRLLAPELKKFSKADEPHKWQESSECCLQARMWPSPVKSWEEMAIPGSTMIPASWDCGVERQLRQAQIPGPPKLCYCKRLCFRVSR